MIYEVAMDKDMEKILLSAEEITALTADIADKINKDYEGKNLVLLGLLTMLLCKLIVLLLEF